MQTYKLAEDGKTPIPCDITELSLSDRTHVAKDTFPNGYVSTVFLGLDHSYNNGPPVLWETMIFGGPFDEYQERYTSYEAAVAGHARAVQKVNGVLPR